MSRSPKPKERRQKAEVTVWLRQAFEAHQDGRLAEARQRYEAILAAEPRQFDALHLLGVVLGQQGQVREGIQRVRSALRLQPRSADALVNLGELLRRNDDREPAVRAFAAALREGPRYDAHMNLGLLYLANEQYVEAASHFGSACGLKPDQADVWNNLGLAWQAQGQLADALFAFERVRSLKPGDVNALVNTGNVLLEKREITEAIQYYRDALKADGDCVTALYGLARAQATAGDEAAIATMQRAVTLAPDRPDLHHYLGYCFRLWGQFDEAFRSYRVAVQLPSRADSTYAALAHCRRIRPEDSELIDEMVALLKTTDLSDKERPYVCFALGKAYDDIGKYEEAIRYFDRGNKLAKAWHPFDCERYSNSIDRMITAFDTSASNRCRAIASSSARPIIIIGMPRSGTTLVEQIIASHVSVAPGGELPFWGQEGARCVLTAVENGDLTGASDVGNRYLGILDAISGTAARVTDKMPDNFLVLGAIHALFPEARILHCRRDPVDVALSNYFTVFAEGQDFSYDRETLVFASKEYQRIMAHWRSVLPSDRFMEVDYAEMVSDRESVSRHIIAFCGLEWDDACLTPHQTRRAIHTASAWQARQPVYRTSLNRWRHYEPWLGVFRDLWHEPDDPSAMGVTASVERPSVQTEPDVAR